VDMSGDHWKAEDSVMFFIYTPVFTVSLAIKKNRPKLLAIHPLRCPPVLYFLLSQLQSSIYSKETNIKMLSGDDRN